MKSYNLMLTVARRWPQAVPSHLTVVSYVFLNHVHPRTHTIDSPMLLRPLMSLSPLRSVTVPLLWCDHNSVSWSEKARRVSASDSDLSN